MTRVSLTVTKNLEEVPAEVASQMTSMSTSLRDLAANIETTAKAISLGLSMGSVSDEIKKKQEELQNVAMMLDDLGNICSSFSNIEKEKEKEELKHKLKDEVAQIQSETAQRIGRYEEAERLYLGQVSTMKSKISSLTEEVERLTKNTASKNKKTPKKK